MVALASASSSSKAKLKCVMAVLYKHATRYQWLTFNPISRVKTSQRRLRDKDVLMPDEFQQLVQQLSVLGRAMVLLIGSTGLRRSEMISLTWSDLNMRTMDVSVLRSCVRNRIGKTKTKPLAGLFLASSCPKCFAAVACSILLCHGSGFLVSFKSLQRSQASQSRQHPGEEHRPALARIGVTGKQIGGHSSRHSLATNLRSLATSR